MKRKWFWSALSEKHPKRVVIGGILFFAGLFITFVISVAIFIDFENFTGDILVALILALLITGAGLRMISCFFST
jgi:hypothetical protein